MFSRGRARVNAPHDCYPSPVASRSGDDDTATALHRAAATALHRAAAAACLTAAAATLFACGGLAGSPGAPSDAGTGSDGTTGPTVDAAFDAGSCPSLPPDGGIPIGETPADGTLDGAAVGATLCNASAQIYVSPYTTPPNRILLMLNSSSPATTAQFTSPTGASDPLLTGFVAISAAAPGVYSSSDAQSCGGLVVSYSLPLPPGVDCDGGNPPQCPQYCASACSGFGCTPCAPSPPEDGYEAHVASDCLGSTQTVTGSWSVTLTSVTPSSGVAGRPGTYYTPHGTFVAQVSDENGGTDTATLTLSF